MTDISNALIIYIAYNIYGNNWKIPFIMTICLVGEMIFKKIIGR